MQLKPPTPSKEYSIVGYNGIFKVTSKEDNILYLENKSTSVKTSLIYGIRHPNKGYLTGAVNPNLIKI